MLELQAIEHALKEGAVLKGFRSGGGIRIIHISVGDTCIGYGEHLSIKDALGHANQDIIDKHLSYDMQYAGENAKYPHYITGSPHPSSMLDSYILKGNKITIQYFNQFITTLTSFKETQIPEAKDEPGNYQATITGKANSIEGSIMNALVELQRELQHNS